MPSIPVTGLSGLGAALADAGADYLGRTRQTQDEARRRGQQLQDVQAARDYQDQVRREERSGRLEDETKLQTMRQAAALKTVLVNEGLLSPGDVDKPEAVTTAWNEMQRRGLDRMYQDLLSTPGLDGKPLLTQEDLSNPAKIAAAKDALGAIKAKQLQFSMGQQSNAQATVDNLEGQLAGVRRRSQEVAKTIDAPAQQYTPASPEVLQLAAQLAEQSKPGSGRDRQAIAAMAPMAMKQLNEQALLAHAQRVQAATRELESLRYNEAQLTNAMREAMQTFKVAPSKGASAAVLEGPASAAPAGPKAASADQMAAAMDAVFGKQTPAAGAASSGPTVLANPTNEPIIARENTRRAAVDWQKNLADPYTAALDKVDRIKADIQRVRSGAPPPGALAPGMFGAPADLYSNPTVQANSLSALLVELDQAQKDAEAARRAMLGVPSVPKPALAPAPTPGAMLSNPMPSGSAAPVAPGWWNAGAPAPAMGF
jgi:hypothetical protein